MDFTPRALGRRNSLVRLFALGALLLAMASCATAPSRDAVPPFRQGVAAADQQTSSAFADVNSFLRRQQVERALHQQALTEDLFVEALASEDLARWRRAFALIDSYAEKLERLLDPDLRSGVEGELSALGEKIGSMRGDQLPAGISAAFTRFGGLLVQLKGERDALEAVRKADPSVQGIFSAMLEAIGPDSDSGVRGTVWTSYRQVLSRIDVREFRPASTDDARRAAVLHYVQVLDERDAQDHLLGSLRVSLATLAKAHQELALGRQVTAWALLGIVQDEYRAYRERVEALREGGQGAAGKGGAK